MFWWNAVKERVRAFVQKHVVDEDREDEVEQRRFLGYCRVCHVMVQTGNGVRLDGDRVVHHRCVVEFVAQWVAPLRSRRLDEGLRLMRSRLRVGAPPWQVSKELGALVAVLEGEHDMDPLERAGIIADIHRLGDALERGVTPVN